MAENVDCVVVGAGVIGLAIARALAQAGREVIVVESADAIGTGISSRNSEIIHAGIYYPPDSLKARLCVAGHHMLYAYCADHRVTHRRCGKLVVATEEDENAALREIQARAEANGVTGVEWLDGATAMAMEPNLKVTAALLVPSTGMVDSHGLMLAFQGDAEDAGAVIAFNSPVIGGRVGDGPIVLGVGGAEPMELSCRVVVNAAGLGAQAVAGALDGLAPETIPRLHPAKGNYFLIGGPAPFSRPIYPVPAKASLGLHFSTDMSGQARFGPDVEWIDSLDYTVDAGRADTFHAAIRRYWPGVRRQDLQPGYAGIRPKIQAPGEPPADFVLQGEEDHGIQGLINLYGIESPGLTSSLAIAAEVAGMVRG